MSMENSKYDAIIVGAGHAGIEAALACARLNLQTLIITTDLNRIGNMPCNPSIGGPAKGHITREIDALGGEQALATDVTFIHIRMLNTGKGPAVQALRAQVDKARYEQYMRLVVESHKLIHIHQAMVDRLLIENSRIIGLTTSDNTHFFAQGVILTTGTFLNGVIFIGSDRIPAGRRNEPPAVGLSESLMKHGINLGRLKTGTVPRVKLDSINIDKLEIQPHDHSLIGFSFMNNHQNNLHKVDTWISHTNHKTRQVIMDNLDKAALFSGAITGIGPRYCPSIEDKYHKFPEKQSHPVFLEREGIDVDEVYLQGLSTSLPLDVQELYVRTVPGLENAEILLPGYAIEYDYIPPTQMLPTFESKIINGLFFAGQINGTSGYEEAGCQGLMAGINLSLKLQNRPPLILNRSQAYIGILSDDITTKGTSEPYRMFTSRAEFRLLLRHDDADFRLTEIGRSIGIVSDERWALFQDRSDKKNELIRFLEISKFTPVDVNLPHDPDKSIQKIPLKELLRRPELSLQMLIDRGIVQSKYKPDLLSTVETEIKYEGYLKRQLEQAEKMKRWEEFKIPPDFNYDLIKGLSFEGRLKLSNIKPLTIGQASRIDGVRQSDVWLIIVNLEK